MSKEKLIDAIGWLAVLAIVMGFALTNFKILEVNSLIYKLLNILGSVGLIWEASYKKDFQPVVLNIFWLLIALSSIFIAI